MDDFCPSTQDEVIQRKILDLVRGVEGTPYATANVAAKNDTSFPFRVFRWETYGFNLSR